MWAPALWIGTKQAVDWAAMMAPGPTDAGEHHAALPGMDLRWVAIGVVAALLLAGFAVPSGPGEPGGRAAPLPSNSVAPSHALSTIPASATPARAGVAPAAPPANITLNGSSVLNLSESITVDNIILEGASSFSFGNASWTATLTIDGSVFLDGTARMKVWDAYVTFASPYDDSQNLQAYGNATAIFEDALVTSQGHNWGTQLYQDANLTVVSTSLGSWCVVSLNGDSVGYFDNSLLDTDLIPGQSSRVLVVDSAYPHLWLDFGNGSVGNLSLPAPDVETSWSFPEAGEETGISTEIRLVDSWPGLFAVALYPGSSVALSNSSEVDLSFLPTDSSLALQGLRFGPSGNLTVATSQFRLSLRNVTVESWSFYAVASHLSITDSQLGEVMGWSGSTISLSGSNLTDYGGYYATFDTSVMQITDCTVSSFVIAYDDSLIVLQNSSVTTGSNESVLAADAATVELENATFAPGSGYAVSAGGTIALRAFVSVAVDDGAAPPVGVPVTVRYAENGTLVTTAATGAGGTVGVWLDRGEETATLSVVSESYIVTAQVADRLAETTIDVIGDLDVTLTLAPFVLSTNPSNGSLVSAGSPIAIDFAVPMNESATGLALSVAPAIPLDVTWDSEATGVVLTPLTAWPSGSELVLSIGTSAETVDGLSPLTPFLVDLLRGPTGPQPGSSAPQVIATSPGDGAAGVDLNVAITVDFSEPMDPASTAAAFSIAAVSQGPVDLPAVATGLLQVTGSSLLWTAAGFLAPGTTYNVTISTAATSGNGTPMLAPYSFSFATVSGSLVPSVESWLPSNGSLLNSSPTSITVVWNEAMDPATTGGAFAVFPVVAGTVRVANDTLVWTPAGTLQAGRTYTIVIGAGALSEAGVVLPHPLWSSFTVAPPSTGGGAAPGAAPPLLDDLGILGLGIVAGAIVATVVRAIARRGRTPAGGPRTPPG